jgi:phosphatidylglycerophosphate synthase
MKIFYMNSLIHYAGYVRLILIITGHLFKDESPFTAVLFYAIFATLDGIDGWVARKLNQCSSFGAWVSRTLKYYTEVHQ